MLNQVMLIGRVVKDPVVNTTKEGTSITRITLAVRRPFKNNEGNYDTDFITCTAWKKLAETSSDYCTKGSLVCISGRINVRSFDIGDNKRISTSDIVAENITFLQLKRNNPPVNEVPIPGSKSSEEHNESNHVSNRENVNVQQSNGSAIPVPPPDVPVQFS